MTKRPCMTLNTSIKTYLYYPKIIHAYLTSLLWNKSCLNIKKSQKVDYIYSLFPYAQVCIKYLSQKLRKQRTKGLSFWINYFNFRCSILPHIMKYMCFYRQQSMVCLTSLSLISFLLNLFALQKNMYYL